MNSRDMQLARIGNLERQVKRLSDKLGGGPVLTGKIVRPPPHEPAAGTWDAHQQTAVCKHCGLPIEGGTDSAHGWASQGGAACLAPRAEE